MAVQLKVLIVDDEQDLLDLYGELLRQLPSNPEVHTATSGARALALLDSEEFSLLLTDLNMPKMDGFQVLTMVRRNFPALRTAVITGMADDEYRARAYAIGVDLYIEKPQSREELKLFANCIEALLDRVDSASGFRGVQIKNLIDLVQMESLSQSSCVLRMLYQGREGRIWMHNGEVIDAEVGEFGGEAAFDRILGWQTGTFEVKPTEPQRARTIHSSTQNLLLNFAQKSDEAMSRPPEIEPEKAPPDVFRAITKIEGVQSVLTRNGKDAANSWGLEEEEKFLNWSATLLELSGALGEKISAGPLRHAVASSASQKLAMQERNGRFLMLGLHPDLTNGTARDVLRHVGGEWS